MARGGVVGLLKEMGPAASPAIPALEKCLQGDETDFHGAITDALTTIRSASAKH